jgi:hypothetical protein
MQHQAQGIVPAEEDVVDKQQRVGAEAGGRDRSGEQGAA